MNSSNSATRTVAAALTPLQRASLLLAAAIEAAREDPRAYVAFVEILVITTARESARRLERERRTA